MNLLTLLLTILVLCICQVFAAEESGKKPPTMLIVTLFRNKGHTLPYFFSYLEQLDYPKSRIGLW